MFTCKYCAGRSLNGKTTRNHTPYPDYYASDVTYCCTDCHICQQFGNEHNWQALTDVALVTDMLAGWTQTEIAIRYGVHRTTVSRRLRSIRERFQFRPLALLDLVAD